MMLHLIPSPPHSQRKEAIPKLSNSRCQGGIFSKARNFQEAVRKAYFPHADIVSCMIHLPVQRFDETSHKGCLKVVIYGDV